MCLRFRVFHLSFGGDAVLSFDGVQCCMVLLSVVVVFWGLYSCSPFVRWLMIACVHTFAIQCVDVFMCSKVVVMSISLMHRGLRCKRVFVHQSVFFHELSD